METLLRQKDNCLLGSTQRVCSTVTSVIKRWLPVFSPMSNHREILRRREGWNLAVLEIWYEVYNQPCARQVAFTRGQTHCKGMNQSTGLDNWGGDNTSDNGWQSEVWNRSCLHSNNTRRVMTFIHFHFYRWEPQIIPWASLWVPLIQACQGSVDILLYHQRWTPHIFNNISLVLTRYILSLNNL